MASVLCSYSTTFIKNMCLFDTAILPRIYLAQICAKVENTYVQNHNCSILTMKSWKQSQCSPPEEWINASRCIQATHAKQLKNEWASTHMERYYLLCFLKSQGNFYFYVNNNKHHNHVCGYKCGCVFIKKCLDDPTAGSDLQREAWDWGKGIFYFIHF